MDLEGFFKMNSIKVGVAAEMNDTELQKTLAADAVGILALPYPAAKEMVQEGKLVVLGEFPQVKKEIWLIAGQKKIDNQMIMKIMENFSLPQ